MSQYTLTLNQIIKSNIEIFDFPYELFDNTYKPVLEEKIINHYKYREIGVETIGMWKHFLKTKINEIMPYYNDLYYTASLEQRILDNYDVTEEYTRNVDQTGEVDNTEDSITDETDNGTSIKKASDTPMGRVDLNDTNHISELEQIEGDNTKNNTTKVIGSTNTTGNTTENWTLRKYGNIGVQTDSDAIEKFRKTIINIDMMIIEELNTLFMGVY